MLEEKQPAIYETATSSTSKQSTSNRRKAGIASRHDWLQVVLKEIFDNWKTLSEWDFCW